MDTEFFIGQDNILNMFYSYTLKTLPHSILLCGEFGSGRHTLCNMLSERLGLKAITASEKITQEYILDIYSCTVPVLCIIDYNSLSDRDVPAILKFIEEPKSNVFVIVLCTSLSNVISTIKSRCIQISMSKYTKEELRRVYDRVKVDEKYNPNSLLSIAKTPGQVKSWIDCDVDSCIVLSKKIVKMIGRANIANILTISDKIDFSVSGSLIPYDMLLESLKIESMNMVINGESGSYEIYRLTNELINLSNTSKQDNKAKFDNYLYKLKNLYLGGNRV